MNFIEKNNQLDQKAVNLHTMLARDKCYRGPLGSGDDLGHNGRSTFVLVRARNRLSLLPAVSLMVVAS